MWIPSRSVFRSFVGCNLKQTWGAVGGMVRPQILLGGHSATGRADNSPAYSIMMTIKIFATVCDCLD